jgi:transcriptional regulator with XRE-family HTH domain
VIDVSEDNMLGSYLRARRELVQPDSVGLAVNRVRRVAGLRREEVAMLAGISSDYYLRLEQGRDRHPSIQVLEALARVLRLDQAATDHLLGLASPRPRHRQRHPRRETVPIGIQQLLDVLGLPAFVEGRYFDVLAANSLARSLSPNLQVGQNRLRAVFLDPAEKALYPDWDHATADRGHPDADVVSAVPIAPLSMARMTGKRSAPDEESTETPSVGGARAQGHIGEFLVARPPTTAATCPRHQWPALPRPR